MITPVLTEAGRVLVAQALVHRPEVIILDEPTAGVDVEMRRALWTTVSRLQGEGKTIVLVTHHFEEAEALCQRIAVMARGRLAALDTREALVAGKPGLEAAVMDIVRAEAP